MLQTQNASVAQLIVSGVQPSGILHLGNYFGAIKEHIELQHAHAGRCFYFIAEYHALTTFHDGAALRQQAHEIALDYLALGLDPLKANFYRQSDVPEVCELMWILACVTTKGLLDRGHSFKDKKARGISPVIGLWLYPILMAADILAVRGTTVPVGEDQVQHLEMARDIAGYFNNTYQMSVFPLPQEHVNSASTVPGTDGKKMSKSYGNTIPIFSDGPDLRERVMRIKTSSAPLGSGIDCDTDTVFQLFRLVAGSVAADEFKRNYGVSIGYREAKEQLLLRLLEYFEEARHRRHDWSKRPSDIGDILAMGAQRARARAAETLHIVRELSGIGPSTRTTS